MRAESSAIISCELRAEAAPVSRLQLTRSSAIMSAITTTPTGIAMIFQRMPHLPSSGANLASSWTRQPCPPPIGVSRTLRVSVTEFGRWGNVG